MSYGSIHSATVVYIGEWEWDEDNERELARHHLRPDIVIDVAETSPRFRRNRRRRAATHMMIGPDRGGTIWALCIVQVDKRGGVWRAITGWLADDVETEWYKRNR
jgi:hypothetical protein